PQSGAAPGSARMVLEDPDDFYPAAHDPLVPIPAALSDNAVEHNSTALVFELTFKVGWERRRPPFLSRSSHQQYEQPGEHGGLDWAEEPKPEGCKQTQPSDCAEEQPPDTGYAHTDVPDLPVGTVDALIPRDLANHGLLNRSHHNECMSPPS